MAEKGTKWYVLRAVSGKEVKVKEYIEAEMKHNPILGRAVSQILIPMEKHASMKNGKRVLKEKTSMPGYILIEADISGEIASTLRFMPNVLGFLGGLDNPTPCKQSDVNRLLGTVEETEVKQEFDIPYYVGDTVKVTNGPFSGFDATVEEVNAEKHRLKVEVKIFGRKTPLEVSYTEVEKV
ncbi:MAG: transcription termination/antitermination protein NusG [Bacteroidaceae bacterium]|nr:transcription termination/antitermination protein NusG [Bacteroidaceae bacterium]